MPHVVPQESLMHLSQLRFAKYKIFDASQSLDVRPLTILIGRNSSGKSAIVRLPLLFADAVSPEATSPVHLGRLRGLGVDLGGAFTDLIHNRSSHGALDVGFTISDGSNSVGIDAVLQNFDEHKLQLVKRWKLSASGHADVFIEWSGSDPLLDSTKYTLSHGDTKLDIAVTFAGLIPTSDLPSVPQWQELRLSLRSAFQRIGYLGPFRVSPERHYGYPGASPTHVGVGGRDAPALMAADALRFESVVSKAVGTWYKEHLGGGALEVDREKESFSLVIRSSDGTSTSNIVDAGTGLSQALPIVVQRLFDQITDKKTSLEITEQPELHLHPGAHGDLADLYVDSIRASAGVFLIETHSENFVLRVRRRIAEGLPAKSVRLYWIDPEAATDSCILPIDIEQDGSVSHWPTRVFSEDLDELIAIRGAARTHQ